MRATIVVASAVALSAGGGLAIAAGKTSTAPKVVCAAKSTRTLHLASSKGRCATGETTVSIGRAGPTGPAGANGAAGPTGPAGAKGDAGGVSAGMTQTAPAQDVAASASAAPLSIPFSPGDGRSHRVLLTGAFRAQCSTPACGVAWNWDVGFTGKSDGSLGLYASETRTAVFSDVVTLLDGDTLTLHVQATGSTARLSSTRATLVDLGPA